MAGDSAVTVRNSEPAQVFNGAAKVQYSHKANIGFAMWGGACVAGLQQDLWLSDFIDSLSGPEPLGDVAERLASSLNEALAREKRSWKELRRGIHIAGYVDGLPHLYHIHTGDPDLPQHELRVFKDYPYIHVPDLSAYRARLGTVGGYHLRNGYYELFATLFDAIYRFTEVLPQLEFKWPDGSLENRVSLYRLLIKFLADILVADQRLPSVGGEIQALAFTERGLAVDYMRRPLSGAFPCGMQAEFIAVAA